MPAVPAPPEAFRIRVERVSRPALIRLQRLPKLLVPLGTVLLVLVGVLAPLPVGLVALAVVWFFVAWIAYLSWPVADRSSPPTRGASVRRWATRR